MNQSHQQKEKQLLEAYEQYSDAIFRHCFFRVYDREKAQELMQETFTKTWEYLREKDIKYLKAFLYRTANNLVIDYSRKKKEQSLEAITEQGIEFAEKDASDIHKIIDGKEAIKLLNQVEEQYREVVIMRYIDGLKPKEIAEILGESQNVISVRINRGMKKLRAIYGK